MSDLHEEVERHRLARRLDTAVDALADPAQPLVVVDLDAFDANADDLVRRVRSTGRDVPVRLASKSVRIPALIERALAHDGFAGVLAYTLREALWLVEQSLSDDVLMGYPSLDRGALDRLLDDDAARAAVVLMVDDPAHLDVVDAVRGGRTAEIRVALDVDAGLRLASSHVGPKRSPLHETDEVLAVARAVADRPGFRLVGVMTYEGQVAGVPDVVPDQRAKSLLVRRLKLSSVQQLAERRAQIAEALHHLLGDEPLELWNAGGTGSIETTVSDPVVTEVAAGSGLLAPTLFDHYAAFTATPAAYFALPVVRRPSPDVATAAGGGFVASGAAGRDRLPTPWAPPGLHLTSLEGAGEVQTPLTGPGAGRLAIGDRVWFRHAKAGELAEHAAQVHLVQGDAVVDSVATYRGLGLTW